MERESKFVWCNPIAGLTNRIFEYKYHDTKEECLASIERVKQELLAYLEQVEPEYAMLAKCKYCNRGFTSEGRLVRHEKTCKSKPKDVPHD